MRRFIYILCGLLIAFAAMPTFAQEPETPYTIALNRIAQVQRDNLSILDLSGLGLTELPPEIGEMLQLRELYLQDNQLTEFPIEILNLIELQRLSLWGNDITEIPAGISRLTQLSYLDLRDMPITDLPASMVDLRLLRELDLGGTTIPAPTDCRF